jgi:hypothetical protein
MREPHSGWPSHLYDQGGKEDEDMTSGERFLSIRLSV